MQYQFTYGNANLQHLVLSIQDILTTEDYVSITQKINKYSYNSSVRKSSLGSTKNSTFRH